MKTENRVGMRNQVEVGEMEGEGERRDKGADKMMIVLGGREYKGRLWRLVVMMMICKTNYINCGYGETFNMVLQTTIIYAHYCLHLTLNSSPPSIYFGSTLNILHVNPWLNHP